MTAPFRVSHGVSSGKSQPSKRKAATFWFVPIAAYVDHALRGSDWVAEYKRLKETTETKESKCGPKFPLKLLAMLHAVEETGLADIIRFQPHGRAFRLPSIRQRTLQVPERLRFFCTTAQSVWVFAIEGYRSRSERVLPRTVFARSSGFS
jgi:hypothetical protein